MERLHILGVKEVSSVSSIILLPETLRQKLGEQGAKELIELINNATRGTKQDVLETTVDKFERRLSEVKADLIKWMFIFWLGQIGVITGLLAYFK